jgi:hypothetical protein
MAARKRRGYPQFAILRLILAAGLALLALVLAPRAGMSHDGALFLGGTAAGLLIPFAFHAGRTPRRTATRKTPARRPAAR